LDKVEILSGVFEEKTLGTPIAMLVWNQDADSSKYNKLKEILRPGHGDLTWRMKFGHVDWRGGGRGSARETVGRVAAGAVAKKLLGRFNIKTTAFSRAIAGIWAEGELNQKNSSKIDLNSVRTIDGKRAKEMEEAIINAKNEGDSVGGIVEVVSTGVPPGLGEPVFNKLSADLAGALMSIPGAKGVEIGAGFKLAWLCGSLSNDELEVRKTGKLLSVSTKTNNSGGILGGISNGMPIVARVAFKPTSSIAKKQDTVNIKTRKNTTIEVGGRHDPCIVPRAIPIVEAMVNLVLADHGLISGLIPRSIQ